MRPDSQEPPTNRSLRVVSGLVAASFAVLAACLLSAFRRDFCDDIATAWRVNGPRVLFAASVGAALALSGSLRLLSKREPAFRELELLAAAAGIAGGGWGLSRYSGGVTAGTCFVLGGAATAAILVSLVRWLDQARRWVNIAVAALLVGLGLATAFAGTYARERSDWIAPVVAWLLGDLTGTSFFSASAMLVATLALSSVALRQLAAGASLNEIALATFSIACGAAGPLAFVGTLAPRTVNWLATGASPRALVLTGMLAGGATVAAVDAVPRLLLGGYDFGWNLPAVMLAIPIFLGWNRTRLRREVGPAHIAFEIFEIALITALTIGAIALAMILTRVIRLAT